MLAHVGPLCEHGDSGLAHTVPSAVPVTTHTLPVSMASLHRPESSAHTPTVSSRLRAANGRCPQGSLGHTTVPGNGGIELACAPLEASRSQRGVAGELLTGVLEGLKEQGGGTQRPGGP